ncbi:uncharacterized protein LOC123553868 [Mercenaria mercenaria]|uniref:uncharacterized protein LOC123553868 n=1 Tax=Mercenaria mercenaria TaxID=6596 RepID=UPI00234EEB0D|nr:uncharacterized protein LOC123553868 [Mercenaria mercenaria]
MRHLKISAQAFVIAHVIIGVVGQNEICTFYGLEANCRYRIDAISLSQIRADINQCADPVEVTFIIKNERPHVDFKHTFNSADTLVSVPRFTVHTQLRVRLTKKEDDVINIEADFYVYGQARADFINEDVKLRGLEEHCPFLNAAAKIAIGVMGGLAVIAAFLIFTLLFIRYKRRKKRAANAENQLVQNAAEPGTSSPGLSLTNLNENYVTSNHVTSVDSENGGINTTERNAVLTNENRNTNNAEINDTNDVKSGGERSSSHGERRKDLHGPDVRFSEILKTENLKISDC